MIQTEIIYGSDGGFIIFHHVTSHTGRNRRQNNVGVSPYTAHNQRKITPLAESGQKEEPLWCLNRMCVRVMSLVDITAFLQQGVNFVRVRVIGCMDRM